MLEYGTKQGMNDNLNHPDSKAGKRYLYRMMQFLIDRIIVHPVISDDETGMILHYRRTVGDTYRKN